MGTGLNPYHIKSDFIQAPSLDHMVGTENRDNKMVPKGGGKRRKEGTDYPSFYQELPNLRPLSPLFNCDFLDTG